MGYFSNEDKDQFRDQGFVVKQGVVRPKLLEKAVDRFWDEIGLDRSDPACWTNSGLSGGNLEVSKDSDVRSTLIDSPIQEMCEELVGVDTLEISNYTFAKPIFPTGEPATKWTHPAHGHLDGYTKPGVVHSFTIAVTVNMNDVKPKSGAFTVWPGTHRRAYNYFQDHSLLDGLKAFQDESGNYIDLPHPIENPGPPGTTIFWHHLMMHNAGNNHGRDIRMACVSRFRRKDTPEIMFDFPEDMWTYWEGL